MIGIVLDFDGGGVYTGKKSWGCTLKFPASYINTKNNLRALCPNM